jgi:Periplasmic serine proteases (ClpP class)
MGLAGIHPKRHFNWSIEGTYETSPSEIVKTGLGLEYDVADTLRLRGGINQRTVFYGASVFLNVIKFDLGVSNQLGKSEDLYYSLAARLGRGPIIEKQRRRYARYKRSSYAEFAVGQNLKKGSSEFSLFGGKKIGSNDLLTLINMSNNDPSCKGYIIRVGSLSSSLTSIALVEEIREELLKAKKAGKKIVVYFEGHVGLPGYYLASIGDMIVMPPMGTVSHFGLSLNIKKASQFFEKIGIKTKVFTNGKHKGASGLNSPSLTALNREHLRSVLEDMFQYSLTHIETNRKEIEEG